MKSLLVEFRRATLSTVVLAVICCGAYPLVVYGIAQIAFWQKANGSLIMDAQGRVRGSSLIGQGFASDRYFHPRPSAAGTGYDAISSGGRNLGPTSKKLAESIAQSISEYRAQNGLSADAPVPADAVTASASGLDPHISVANAELQSARVAKARGLGIHIVRDLIRQNTEGPDLGIIGEPGVNVLRLNLALDGVKQ